MAETTKKAAAKKTAAPKYEHQAYLSKDPNEVHIGLADYIVKTTGHTIPVGEVAVVLRLYPLYLKSPDVAAAKAAEKAERDRVKAIKDAEKRERLQVRLDKINADRAKLLADLGIEDDGFEEPEAIEPGEGVEEPVDLAAKREKAKAIAAAAAQKEPAVEPVVESAEEPDEAAWEGEDDFVEEVTEPVTLTPDDEGLWDDEPETANEEEF